MVNKNAKNRKTCTILARYFIKRTQSVCCTVRNEKGEQYNTCIHTNGKTSCTCKAGDHGRRCYHVDAVKASEHARAEQIAAEAEERNTEKMAQMRGKTIVEAVNEALDTVYAQRAPDMVEHCFGCGCLCRGNLCGYCAA